jgi:hypothetical protein
MLGDALGDALGESLGDVDGDMLGIAVSPSRVGDALGDALGDELAGEADGFTLGEALGDTLGDVGEVVGEVVGAALGSVRRTCTDGVAETVTPSAAVAAVAEESGEESADATASAEEAVAAEMVHVTCTDAASTTTVTADSETPAALATFVLTVARSIASKSETSPGEVKVTTTEGLDSTRLEVLARGYPGDNSHAAMKQPTTRTMTPITTRMRRFLLVTLSAGAPWM